MPDPGAVLSACHDHVFLGEGHAHAERRTRAVVWLRAAMTALEKVRHMNGSARGGAREFTLPT